MGVATKTRMTEDEFLRMPDDGGKWELVNGEPKEVPTSTEHDAVGVQLILLLGPQAKGNGAMTMSQAGFRMTDGNIRCPDVSFTRKSRLIGGRPSKGFGDAAPDICIEIISPSEEKAEMMQKVREYFDADAEQVWHIFPDQKMVRVYIAPDVFADYHENDEITGGNILPTFRCRVGEIFEIE